MIGYQYVSGKCINSFVKNENVVQVFLNITYRKQIYLDLSKIKIYL